MEIQLRGKLNANVGRIYNWRLEGSTDDTTWTTLYSTTNTYVSIPVHITLDPANTANKYTYFRIHVVAAESPYSGLTAFQIYTVYDLGLDLV